MGTLYIVPTPIGNLEDITLRALRILGEVSLIAAEDTRTTGRLLAHFAISTSITSYHEHNKLTKLDKVLDTLYQGDVALVSDAGTPGISDPGYELVRAVIDAGFPVVALPGPNALLPALVASGLPTDSFLFVGFLPRKSSERIGKLLEVAELSYTLVFYEAPHRVLDTLSAMLEVLGDRPICVGRELTKLYEEIWRGPIREALVYFEDNQPRGEFTLVVGGATLADQEVWEEQRVRAAFEARLAAGESRSTAAKAVAANSGWPRRDIYKLI